MSILDKAKPPTFYRFTTYERWYRHLALKRLHKALEARRLALLSVADPRGYKMPDEGRK